MLMHARAVCISPSEVKSNIFQPRGFHVTMAKEQKLAGTHREEEEEIDP